MKISIFFSGLEERENNAYLAQKVKGKWQGRTTRRSASQSVQEALNLCGGKILRRDSSQGPGIRYSFGAAGKRGHRAMQGWVLEGVGPSGCAPHKPTVPQTSERLEGEGFPCCLLGRLRVGSASRESGSQSCSVKVGGSARQGWAGKGLGAPGGSEAS